jgi:hypothetical protein
MIASATSSVELARSKGAMDSAMALTFYEASLAQSIDKPARGNRARANRAMKSV